MPGELSRHHGAELSHEPEYIEINHEEEALRQALQLARDLSAKLRDAVPDPDRQRALRDLVAIVDNQLQEERALLKDPSYQREPRPADRQQFQRAFEYLKRTSRT